MRTLPETDVPFYVRNRKIVGVGYETPESIAKILIFTAVKPFVWLLRSFIVLRKTREFSSVSAKWYTTYEDRL